MATPGNKRLLEWGSIIIAVVLIAAGIVYYQHFYRPEPEVETKDVSIETLPAWFPADIPLETGAGVTANYTASAPGVPFQATRTFTSAASVAENIEKYRSFFSGNAWDIVAASSSEQYSFLIATSQSQNLQATVFVDGSSEATTSHVDITVTPFTQVTSSAASPSPTP